MKVKSMSWTRPEIIVNKFNPSALAHGVEGIFWSWSTKEPERRSALMLKSKNLNRLLYAWDGVSMRAILKLRPVLPPLIPLAEYQISWGSWGQGESFLLLLEILHYFSTISDYHLFTVKHFVCLLVCWLRCVINTLKKFSFCYFLMTPFRDILFYILFLVWYFWY